MNEVPDPIAERFERLLSLADRDENSRLGLEELRAFSRKLQAMEKVQISNEEIEKDVQRLLKQFDKNQNGQLTRKELPKRMKARFAKMDGDGNGHLDRSELARTVQVLRRLWGAEKRKP